MNHCNSNSHKPGNNVSIRFVEYVLAFIPSICISFFCCFLTFFLASSASTTVSSSLTRTTCAAHKLWPIVGHINAKLRGYKAIPKWATRSNSIKKKERRLQGITTWHKDLSNAIKEINIAVFLFAKSKNLFTANFYISCAQCLLKNA